MRGEQASTGCSCKSTGTRMPECTDDDDDADDNKQKWVRRESERCENDDEKEKAK